VLAIVAMSAIRRSSPPSDRRRGNQQHREHRAIKTDALDLGRRRRAPPRRRKNAIRESRPTLKVSEVNGALKRCRREQIAVAAHVAMLTRAPAAASLRRK